MKRIRHSIQIQIILFVLGALMALAVVLGGLWAEQQRAGLVAANQDRSLTIIGSVNNTIEAVRPLITTLEDMTELDSHLAGLVRQNENVAFIAVILTDGTALFHSDPQYKSGVLAELAELPSGQAQRRQVPGFGAVYVTGRVIPGEQLVDAETFSIVVATPAAVIDEQIGRSRLSLALATLVSAAVALLVLVLALQRQLVRPIQDLTTTATAISQGDLSVRAHVGRQDEVGQLGGAFNSMAGQLNELINTLEARVADRTRDLHAAGDVARQISTVLDIDRLLQEVTTLTVDRFDIYSTIVFLLDEERQSLVRSVTNLPLALKDDDTTAEITLDTEPSLIALAGRTRETVVVNDVTQSTVYLPYSGLPETRSELAIPIIQGNRLLGVLDLQSRHVDHFDSATVSVLTTITEQLAIAIRNAQLFRIAEDARAEAEEASRIKSHFLASMSHELRTPLNAVLNFTEFVADGMLGPVNDQQVETLHKAIDSGEHLLSLINDILDLTKIEVGMMELFIEDFDLNTTVRSVLDTAEGLTQDRPEILVTSAVQPDLPTMTGDRRRIKQILLNLVSNAIKFTRAGSVTIRAEALNGNIHLAVEDTGIGIAPKDQELIFESFRQTEAGIESSVGTGLGLAITRYLVEAHGGQIWVESALGQGSTFHVNVPVQARPVLAPAPSKRGSEAQIG